MKLRCTATWGRPTWCQSFCLNYEAQKVPNCKKNRKIRSRVIHHHDLTILNIQRTFAARPLYPEISTRDCNHYKRMGSGHVTTSVQSTASYTSTNLVVALKSCYRKAQKCQQYLNVQLAHSPPFWISAELYLTISRPPVTHVAPAYRISTKSGNPKMSHRWSNGFFPHLFKERNCSPATFTSRSLVDGVTSKCEDIGQSPMLPTRVLAFRYVVQFWNQSASNANGVENPGQISGFSATCKC